MRQKIKNTLSYLKRGASFSRLQLVIFAVVFAGIGGYVLISSFAATTDCTNYPSVPSGTASINLCPTTVDHTLPTKFWGYGASSYFYGDFTNSQYQNLLKQTGAEVFRWSEAFPYRSPGTPTNPDPADNAVRNMLMTLNGQGDKMAAIIQFNSGPATIPASQEPAVVSNYDQTGDRSPQNHGAMLNWFFDGGVDVQGYENYNEPDNNLAWYPDPSGYSGQLYVHKRVAWADVHQRQFSDAVHQALSAKGRTVKILGEVEAGAEGWQMDRLSNFALGSGDVITDGGGWPWPTNNLASTSSGPIFDAYDFHPYPSYGDSGQSGLNGLAYPVLSTNIADRGKSSLYAFMNSARSFFDSNGAPGKQLTYDEGGFDTNTNIDALSEGVYAVLTARNQAHWNLPYYTLWSANTDTKGGTGNYPLFITPDHVNFNNSIKSSAARDITGKFLHNYKRQVTGFNNSQVQGGGMTPGGQFNNSVQRIQATAGLSSDGTKMAVLAVNLDLTTSQAFQVNMGTTPTGSITETYMLQNTPVGNMPTTSISTSSSSFTVTMQPGSEYLFEIPISSSTGGTPSPTVSLSASPSTISAGSNSTLSWSSSNATSCSAPWTSSTGTSGSVSVSPTTTTSYTITCSGSGGIGSATATVTVSAATSTSNLVINAGGSAASPFTADTGYSGGDPYSTTSSIDTSGASNPAPQSVYQTERFGNFTYTITGLGAGANYNVRLHFAEIYWTSVGQRVFNVAINGQQVLSNFDIIQSAGAANKAIIKEFTAPANSAGQIAITFSSVVDNAKVSGIEIVKAPTSSGLTVPAATVGHNIDGNLSESDWKISTPITKAVTGSTNDTASWGALWDTKYLYIGAKISDSSLSSNPANDPGSYWQNDSVEVYVDPNTDGGTSYDSSDKQLAQGWNDSGLFGISSSTPGVLHYWAAISGGYSIEMAIPWTSLGVSPSSGMTTALDIGVNDSINGTRVGQLMWNGTANNWQDPSNFGKLTLAGTPVTPDTTPPSVIITTPANSSTVSGTINISANASDNIGVTKVEFYLDGVLNNTDTASPYGYSLDTTTLSNGPHSLIAKAYDGAGNSSESSITVTVQNGDTTPPSTPSNLSATAPASNSVTLSWTASTDNVGVAGYYIIRSGTTIAKTTGTGTTYSDSAVSPQTNYSYQVIAYDAVGNNSQLSNTATVTTPAAPDNLPPSTPSNLTAAAVSSSQINLSWSAATDNIGVTGYDVYRNNSKVATVSTTSYGDTGLAASTAYSYYVIARDAAGNTSPPSNTANATTQAPPAPTGTLSGKISSTSGNIAGHAQISIPINGSTNTYTSYSNDTYVITGLPPATYQATYSAKFTNPQTQAAAISSNSTTTLNVTLQSTR